MLFKQTSALANKNGSLRKSCVFTSEENHQHDAHQNTPKSAKFLSFVMLFSQHMWSMCRAGSGIAIPRPLVRNKKRGEPLLGFAEEASKKNKIIPKRCFSKAEGLKNHQKSKTRSANRQNMPLVFTLGFHLFNLFSLMTLENPNLLFFRTVVSQ